MKKYRTGAFHTSGEIAKTRAELTVSADRIDCDPRMLDQLREEILNVLSKYVNTDEEDLMIRITFFYERERRRSDAKTIQIK